MNLRDMQTILVLFDTRCLEEAAACIRQLKGLGKMVTVCAWQAKGESGAGLGADYRVLLQQEAGQWRNNPVSRLVKELEKKHFDAIIDLSVSRNISLEYILARTPASVKTGLKKNDFPMYDLAITDLPPEAETKNLQVRELGNQILYYLDQIQTVKPVVGR
jgi:hypothetical protein